VLVFAIDEFEQLQAANSPRILQSSAGSVLLQCSCSAVNELGVVRKHPPHPPQAAAATATLIWS